MSDDDRREHILTVTLEILVEDVTSAQADEFARQLVGADIGGRLSDGLVYEGTVQNVLDVERR